MTDFWQAMTVADGDPSSGISWGLGFLSLTMAHLKKRLPILGLRSQVDDSSLQAYLPELTQAHFMGSTHTMELKTIPGVWGSRFQKSCPARTGKRKLPGLQRLSSEVSFVTATVGSCWTDAIRRFRAQPESRSCWL